MEKIAPPFLRRSGGVRWASLAIFFLALGLGDFLHLGTPGTCLRSEQAYGFFRLVSPAEGAGALALAHLISCMLLVHMIRPFNTSLQQPPSTTPFNSSRQEPLSTKLPSRTSLKNLPLLLCPSLSDLIGAWARASCSIPLTSETLAY